MGEANHRAEVVGEATHQNGSSARRIQAPVGERVTTGEEATAKAKLLLELKDCTE